jgi:Domain of unknown function (DUF5666)
MNKAMSTGVRVAVWSAAGLLTLGVAATAANAVTSHHSHSTGSSAPSGPGGYGGNGGRGFGAGGHGGFPAGGGFPGPGGGLGLMRGVVHGVETITVNGKYQTVAQQSGTITTVSATSITVTSSDKYAATYAITSSTKILDNGKSAKATDLKAGDTVSIGATESGSDLTATVIADGKFPSPSMGHGRGPGGMPFGGRGPGSRPSGAPTPSASASSSAS